MCFSWLSSECDPTAGDVAAGGRCYSSHAVYASRQVPVYYLKSAYVILAMPYMPHVRYQFTTFSLPTFRCYFSHAVFYHLYASRQVPLRALFISGLRIRIRIIFGSWILIRIRIKVKIPKSLRGSDWSRGGPWMLTYRTSSKI
jgi:hypothetical protein